MTSKRVLVTGGTGMLGRATVPLLVQQGFTVRLLVQSDREQLPFDVPVELYVGDILDVASCQRASQGMDAVVHLAGRAHTRTEPALFFRVNVDGTRNLIDAAAKEGISHFLFISSAGVYGDGRPEPFAETSTLHPTTPYGLSKLQAERLVVESAKRYGMSFTILRPSVVYGAGDRGNVLRMLKAVDRRLFATVGNGTTRKSMTYVGNVAEVIKLCLVCARAQNETFNVADPEPYATGDLARTIAQVLGKPLRSLHIPVNLAMPVALSVDLAFRVIGRNPPVSPRDIKVLAADLVLDVSKIYKCLGYRSETLLVEGLKLTNAWYQQNRI